MSITAETAQEHKDDPAVLCCRAEAGITIGPENLEDPAILDELVDSGLLSLDGVLKIGQILGAKLTKTCDSLSPVTADVVDGIVADESDAGEALAETTAADPVTETPVIQAASAATTIRNGKLIISIKEGKDIYIELPV